MTTEELETLYGEIEDELIDRTDMNQYYDLPVGVYEAGKDLKPGSYEVILSTIELDVDSSLFVTIFADAETYEKYGSSKGKEATCLRRASIESQRETLHFRADEGNIVIVYCDNAIALARRSQSPFIID